MAKDNGKVYIKDESGNQRRDNQGNDLFYSEKDGDHSPDTRQTVYSEKHDIFGEISTTHDKTYNPSTGEFNDD